MADGAPTSSEPIAAPVEGKASSVEATIQSSAQGGTESSCNNNNAGSSSVTQNVHGENTLEYAEQLMEKGSAAIKEEDFEEASDCFSRALEIRVAHYGELAPECVHAYYRYGCALLYKAQDESDPLGAGAVPKKEVKPEESEKEGSIKSVVSGETSAASVSSNGKEESSNRQEGVSNDGDDGADQEDDEGSEDEDLARADEDESDLDLAWKMLDVARAIAEKRSEDTMEKVDILSALAEVALEREDLETSLSDYLKALSILERLVELDSRRIAELNFRICLCLEISSKAQEAIPFCEKAISVCKSRVQRLMKEAKSSAGSTATSADPESNLTVQPSSSSSQSVDTVADKAGEIEDLTSLCSELEKKLEDLQPVASNQNSILSDILGMVAAKAKGGASGSSTVMSSSRIATASSGNFESPTVSTAHTNGSAAVTHLGVVGRGVKRVVMNAESSPAKKPALDPSADNGGSNMS